MSDENKNIENKQEENQNRQECNKSWWENVELKPNLKYFITKNYIIKSACFSTYPLFFVV